MSPVVEINRRSGIPIYVQVKQHFVYLISTGQLVDGERLPGIRELASELDVAPATISAAYRSLRDDGFLKQRAGSGTFVHIPDGYNPTFESGDDRHEAQTDLVGYHIGQAVHEAANQGIGREELQALLDSSLERAQFIAMVVVVAATQEVADKYRDVVRGALGPNMQVRVEANSLSEFRKSTNLVGASGMFTTVVSLISTYSAVIEHTTTIPSLAVMPLFVSLEESVGRTLAAIKPGECVGIVTQPEYLSGTLALVHGLSPDAEIIWSTGDGESEIYRLLESSDHAFFTRGVADLTLQVSRRTGIPATEMEFVASPQSLKAIREHVHALESASDGG